ncbi:nuclear pore complex protein DDB_G0274915-like [Mizuhopecten yessoensis]|uniref:Single-strand selective monofunctional uracil-DNA glycosylase n=1 Tax=Mizuhopecten yessoensis TaxID=6573 RepID=A0A210QUJ4_MIZYE|nr:nuclear pore complex protein DDB_G0274915-like [Mizuhopecten yessoensis]XP_021349388.1 nuclear pore complex protein DDB_G0274915-like [Mizuhopecten yessoensis]OWF52410.1 Single-strand selective monofunctional uracil-DNA glycosylase [Mizuhopecten yessoensis]
MDIPESVLNSLSEKFLPGGGGINFPSADSLSLGSPMGYPSQDRGGARGSANYSLSDPLSASSGPGLDYSLHGRLAQNSSSNYVDRQASGGSTNYTLQERLQSGTGSNYMADRLTPGASATSYNVSERLTPGASATNFSLSERLTPGSSSNFVLPERLTAGAGTNYPLSERLTPSAASNYALSDRLTPGSSSNYNLPDRGLPTNPGADFSSLRDGLPANLAAEFAERLTPSTTSYASAMSERHQGTNNNTFAHSERLTPSSNFPENLGSANADYSLSDRLTPSESASYTLSQRIQNPVYSQQDRIPTSSASSHYTNATGGQMPPSAHSIQQPPTAHSGHSGPQNAHSGMNYSLQRGLLTTTSSTYPTSGMLQSSEGGSYPSTQPKHLSTTANSPYSRGPPSDGGTSYQLTESADPRFLSLPPGSRLPPGAGAYASSEGTMDAGSPSYHPYYQHQGKMSPVLNPDFMYSLHGRFPMTSSPNPSAYGHPESLTQSASSYYSQLEKMPGRGNPYYPMMDRAAPVANSYYMSQQRQLQYGQFPPGMVPYGQQQASNYDELVKHQHQGYGKSPEKRSKGYGKRKMKEEDADGDDDYDYSLCNHWYMVSEHRTDVPLENNLTKTTEKSLDNSETKDSDVSSVVIKQEPETRQPILTIFNFSVLDGEYSLSDQYLLLEQKLCNQLRGIQFQKPVSHIYNPLVYAFETHADFVRRYTNKQKPILFLGMNPGPFGMSQNGVPFGEVGTVRDWLGIKGTVHKPAREHPKRPVMGLACHRSEVSGSRFWGFFKNYCKSPENFFKNCLIHNMCPLAFMARSGRNLTPPELFVWDRNMLTQACSAALLELIDMFDIQVIVAIGRYVEARALQALKEANITNIKVHCLQHPSPLNPQANKGWDSIAMRTLQEFDLLHYIVRDQPASNEHPQE